MEKKNKINNIRKMWCELPVFKTNLDSESKCYNDEDEYDDISIIKYKFMELLKMLVKNCVCAGHPICMLRYEACTECMAWVDDIDMINILIEAKMYDSWVNNLEKEDMVMVMHTKPYLTKTIIDNTSRAMTRIQLKLTDIDIGKYLFPE